MFYLMMFLIVLGNIGLFGYEMFISYRLVYVNSLPYVNDLPMEKH